MALVPRTGSTAAAAVTTVPGFAGWEETTTATTVVELSPEQPAHNFVGGVEVVHTDEDDVLSGPGGGVTTRTVVQGVGM